MLRPVWSPVSQRLRSAAPPWALLETGPTAKAAKSVTHGPVRRSTLTLCGVTVLYKPLGAEISRCRFFRDQSIPHARRPAANDSSNGMASWPPAVLYWPTADVPDPGRPYEAAACFWRNSRLRPARISASISIAS